MNENEYKELVRWAIMLGFEHFGELNALFMRKGAKTNRQKLELLEAMYDKKRFKEVIQ